MASPRDDVLIRLSEVCALSPVAGVAKIDAPTPACCALDASGISWLKKLIGFVG
jgi:hypothetical protein